MQKRWKPAVPGALVAGLVVTGAWACDVGSMAGDAMVDAGGVLADAGELLRDAAGSDAAAQDPPVDLACDVERRRVVENATLTQELTYWYAELRDASIAPDSVRAVRSLHCDFEYFGTRTWEPTCPDGATCTGLAQPEPLRCRVQSGAEIEEGLVRVYCGSRTVFRDPETGAMTYEQGSRPRSLHVTVVR